MTAPVVCVYPSPALNLSRRPSSRRKLVHNGMVEGMRAGTAMVRLLRIQQQQKEFLMSRAVERGGTGVSPAPIPTTIGAGKAKGVYAELLRAVTNQEEWTMLLWRQCYP